jgi:hypothetical protein
MKAAACRRVCAVADFLAVVLGLSSRARRRLFHHRTWKHTSACWNGGPYLKDRVGQGAHDYQAPSFPRGFPHCRLAQIKDLTSDGLLQRYLLVAMRTPVRGDENYPVAGAEGNYAKLIQNLHQAPSLHYAFSAKAAVVRTRVLDRLFNLEQLQGFPDALIGAVGKMKGYYGRLALTLHVAKQHAARPSGQPSASGTDISKDTAHDAEKLLFDFLLPHIFGVYDVIGNGGKDRETLRAIAGFILAGARKIHLHLRTHHENEVDGCFSV